METSQIIKDRFLKPVCFTYFKEAGDGKQCDACKHRLECLRKYDEYTIKRR